MPGSRDDAISPRYVVAAAIVAVVGAAVGSLVGLLREVDDYKIAAGASAFALIYIVAQAIERINELLILCLYKKNANFAEGKKRRALKAIKAPVPERADAGATDGKANAPDELASARRELRILTMATAFALSFLLLGSLDTGLLAIVTEGNHPPELLDWLISAAVFAGGTSALHDLISKVQKSKEKDEAAA